MYTYFNTTSITTMTMTTAIAISSKGMIIPAAIVPPEPPPPVLGSLVPVELVEVELVVIGGPVVANERPLYSDYVISVLLDAVAVVGIITVDEVLGTTVGVRVTPNEKINNETIIISFIPGGIGCLLCPSKIIPLIL